MNSFNPYIQFIFENVSTVASFLDVSCSIKNNQLIFDIYHKPTNSFCSLHYCSCHPKYTKNNIGLSLGQRIIRIFSENKEQYLTHHYSGVIMN